MQNSEMPNYPPLWCSLKKQRTERTSESRLQSNTRSGLYELPHVHWLCKLQSV